MARQDAPNIIMLVGESHGPNGCYRTRKLRGYIDVSGDVRWFDEIRTPHSERLGR